MGIVNVQSNLTGGELDPQLTGRIDIETYYNGLKKAKNVITVPQGGVKKRPGTELIDNTSDRSNNIPFVFNVGPPRIEEFEAEDNERFVLVFQAALEPPNIAVLLIHVYFLDNFQETIDIRFGPQSFSYELDQMDYAQFLDTFIITHPNFAPIKVKFISLTNWAVDTNFVINIPLYDFNDANSPTPQQQNQKIFLQGAQSGDRFKLSLDGILTDEIIFSDDSTTDGQRANREYIKQELLSLPNIVDDPASIGVVFVLPGVYQIAFAGPNAKNWPLIGVTPTYDPGLDFEPLAEITQIGASRKEAVWSDTRGWPKTVTFHEGRLWFGGSRELKSAIWGSVVNDFFNFNEGKGRDDEGIFYFADTDTLNEINAIYSNRTLQIFTSGAEFYIPQSPITPSNVYVSVQTRNGAKKVRPITFSGETYYVKNSGNSLNNFIFLDSLQANSSSSVSLLSTHLIRDPIQLAVQKGTEVTDANYIYLANADGSLTVYNTLPDQAVNNFTDWVTDKPVVSCGVVDNKLYLILEQNGSYYLVKENSKMNTDFGIYNESLGSDIVTGLDHLNGETVTIKADGVTQQEQIVQNGQVQLNKPADVVDIGLSFLPIVETMPVNLSLQSGTIFGKRKKLGRAMLQLFESNGVIVNDQRITDKTTGINQFSPPEPQSGLRRIYLGGWSLEATMTITQTTPYNMQILAIGMEVNI